jgi:hypothetical protein
MSVVRCCYLVRLLDAYLAQDAKPFEIFFAVVAIGQIVGCTTWTLVNVANRVADWLCPLILGTTAGVFGLMGVLFLRTPSKFLLWNAMQDAATPLACGRVRQSQTSRSNEPCQCIVFGKYFVDTHCAAGKIHASVPPSLFTRPTRFAVRKRQANSRQTVFG